MNLRIPQPALNDYLNKCAGIAEALETRDREEFVLRMMAFSEFREMKYPAFARIASQQYSDAFAARDWALIARLGKVLDQPSQSFWRFVMQDKLAGLMLSFWENGFDGSSNAARIQDCSDQVVFEIAQFMFGKGGYSFSSVRKTRQRLGLPKPPRPKFTKFKAITPTRFEVS